MSYEPRSIMELIGECCAEILAAMKRSEALLAQILDAVKKGKP